MKQLRQRALPGWSATTAAAALVLAASGMAAAAGAPARTPPPAALRPELRIDGDFSNALSVAVDSRGNMYVADADLQEIRVFSPAGAPLPRIGRRGGGPGEFRRLLSVAVGRGDTVFALDVSQQRVTAFAPGAARRVAFTTPLPGVAAAQASYGLLLPSAGGFVVQYSTPYGVRSGAPARYISVRGVARDGSLLPAPALRVPDRESLSTRLPDDRVQVGSLPYGREPFLRLGPEDLLYYGWSGSPVVWMYRLDGRRAGSLRLPFAQGRVGDAEIDRLLGSLDPKSLGYTALSQAAREKRIPRTKPIFRGLVVDDRGRMWINVVRPEDVLVSTERGFAYTSAADGDPGESTWWVIRRDGRAVGKVPLPRNVDVELVKGGKVYGIEVDEYGVQRLVRFSVRI